MARQDFIDQLRNLGYEVTDLGDNRLWVPFAIPSGRLAGQEIKLGFVVGEDFPATPPSGPHVSPQLFPLQAGGTHPTGGIHTSPFGGDWQYWSRPFPNWGGSDHTVRAYMAHVRHLFDTL